MATAAYAIARAALVSSYVDIDVALAGVRVFAISRGALRYLERFTAHDVSFRLLTRGGPGSTARWRRWARRAEALRRVATCSAGSWRPLRRWSSSPSAC
jgi:hypothetical protein